MMLSKNLFVILALLICFVTFSPVQAQSQKWVASWAASAHGPYPSGNASAQPVLQYAIESAEIGANDQTFRLILRPELWGKSGRLRFSNAFGTKPVTFDDVFIGLQSSAGNVAEGTNSRVTFSGKRSVTIEPGAVAYSDGVSLSFVKNSNDALLAGRKLAVSFHVVGSSGPMTWHAKAIQTSYLTAPRAGSHGGEDSDASFPYTTTSWYFLDAFEVMAPANTVVVACFGDSITDGTLSTLNGDDRWPDVLARRLHASYGNRISVINAGIGGNQIIGPAHSFMHSFLAKGRLLYTHDQTIADLFGRLRAIGERDTQLQLLQAATGALPAIYKAHKFFQTRGDLEYTALWILYAAPPLAKVEVINARLLADREVIPQAMKLNPAFFKTVYFDLLNTKKTKKTVRAALDAVDAYVAERAPKLFALIIDHLREVGEARSCTEIENHFKRNFGVEHVTTACEYLADQGLIGKASTSARLTKKSNVEVQELAFFYSANR